MSCWVEQVFGSHPADYQWHFSQQFRIPMDGPIRRRWGCGTNQQKADAYPLPARSPTPVC